MSMHLIVTLMLLIAVTCITGIPIQMQDDDSMDLNNNPSFRTFDDQIGYYPFLPHKSLGRAKNHINHPYRQIHEIPGYLFGEKKFIPLRTFEDVYPLYNSDDNDRSAWEILPKRNFDEIDRTGWDGFVEKRSINKFKHQ